MQIVNLTQAKRYMVSSESDTNMYSVIANTYDEVTEWIKSHLDMSIDWSVQRFND